MTDVRPGTDQQPRPTWPASGSGTPPARGDGWLTGTTVVLAGTGGAVGGVDVRGGGPGTRETDLLDPRNAVERVHAVVLTGGSAFGLAAADGVMQGLVADGVGFPVGGPGEVVPIVPAAVIFDLGRGGRLRQPARRRRSAVRPTGPRCRRRRGQAVAQGVVGAGTGASAGQLKGGIGSASAVLAGRHHGRGAGRGQPGRVRRRPRHRRAVRRPVRPGRRVPRAGSPPDRQDVRARPGRRRARCRDRPPAARRCWPRPIGVIATDATLTKAQCAKVAGIGHDGMARAIRPGAHHVRRRHAVHPGDRRAAGARTGRVPRAAGRGRRLRHPGDRARRAGRPRPVQTPRASVARRYRDAFPLRLPLL